jgi:hypothetical protein
LRTEVNSEFLCEPEICIFSAQTTILPAQKQRTAEERSNIIIFGKKTQVARIDENCFAHAKGQLDVTLPGDFGMNDFLSI